MLTLDLKKQLKHLYNPSAKQPEVVDVPSFNFLMVDGAIEKGFEPGNSPLFQENTEACTASLTRSSLCSKSDPMIRSTTR
jgi:hypothetical protein